MDKETYLQHQIKMIQIGRAVSEMDLVSFLAQIRTAEATGPVLDPTMYQKAADNLKAIKNLAEALVPVQDAFEKCFRAVLITAGRGDMETPPNGER